MRLTTSRTRNCCAAKRRRQGGVMRLTSPHITPHSLLHSHSFVSSYVVSCWYTVSVISNRHAALAERAAPRIIHAAPTQHLRIIHASSTQHLRSTHAPPTQYLRSIHAPSTQSQCSLTLNEYIVREWGKLVPLSLLLILFMCTKLQCTCYAKLKYKLNTLHYLPISI